MRNRLLLLSGFIFTILVVGFLIAPLVTDHDPHARPSVSIADSKAKGRYIADVRMTPNLVRLLECDIEFDEAWIETANLRKPLFFGFSYDDAVGYYFLCFTIKKGHECFV